MSYVDADQIPAGKVPKPFERELKVLLAPETHPDVKDFTLLFSTLAPEGGCTDFHTHAESGELMVITAGTGKCWLAGEEKELKPGVAFYAPPGVEHKTLNTGREPLRIVCVFVPPVPLDYIKKNIEAASATEDK